MINDIFGFLIEEPRRGVVGLLCLCIFFYLHAKCLGEEKTVLTWVSIILSTIFGILSGGIMLGYILVKYF